MSAASAIDVARTLALDDPAPTVVTCPSARDRTLLLIDAVAGWTRPIHLDPHGRGAIATPLHSSAGAVLVLVDPLDPGRAVTIEVIASAPEPPEQAT